MPVGACGAAKLLCGGMLRRLSDSTNTVCDIIASIIRLKLVYIFEHHPAATHSCSDPCVLCEQQSHFLSVPTRCSPLCTSWLSLLAIPGHHMTHVSCDSFAATFAFPMPPAGPSPTQASSYLCRAARMALNTHGARCVPVPHAAVPAPHLDRLTRRSSPLALSLITRQSPDTTSVTLPLKLSDSLVCRRATHRKPCREPLVDDGQKARVPLLEDQCGAS